MLLQHGVFGGCQPLSSAHERVPKGGMEVRVAFQAGFWEEEPATNYPTALLPTTYCMVYVHLLHGRWFNILGLYQIYDQLVEGKNSRAVHGHEHRSFSQPDPI